MFGMFTIPALAPILPALARARLYGHTIYETIERKSEIRSPDNSKDVVEDI